MASRTAKVASSIVAGILAGAPLTAPRSAANAAECLTEPGKNAPQGQHWYYRIEHGTKRHCWYTRGGGGTAAPTAPPDDSAQATNQATNNAPKAATRTTENPSRSIQDAHAEYPMPQAPVNTMSAPAPGPAPFATSPVAVSPPAYAQGSAVAARWPSPETTAEPATPPAAADATDSTPATDTAADAPADTPAPAPVAANPAPAKPPVSLQMLFAVIGGALALAGLTASIVYRLGRGRQRRLDPRERRAALWDGVETGPRAPWIEPVIEKTAPDPIPERGAAPSAKTPARAQERYEKIEEILAQLVKQGQQSDA